MSKTYVDHIERIVPRVLRGFWGSRLIGSFALLVDALMQGVAESVTAGWIKWSSGVPTDSLAYHGQDTALERYPVETDEQYKARIELAWETWQLAGGPESILDQLAAAGFPGAEIYTPLEWPTRPPTPYASQFWVFFPEGTHPVTSQGPLIGSFVVGDGTVIGPTGISVEQLFMLRRLIRKWKSGRWVCRELIFEISGWTIGSGHVIGEPGLVIGGETAVVGAL